jgi:hypothetical protein
MYVTLCGKWVLEYVIKVRLDHTRLGWALIPVTSDFKGERYLKTQKRYREEGYVKNEVEIVDNTGNVKDCS